MALTVAQLVVEVGADVRGAMSGLGQVQTRIDRMAGGVRSAAMSLMPLQVALGAVGAIGLRAFTGYEDAMAELIARTGLTGDELERVRELTFDMGRTTQFSAAQAADAMLQLVASGQSASEAMQTLPQVLTLAAISGLDLGTTADALTDVMQMFNLSVQDSAAVVDVLAAAEGASSATVALLVEGLANVGPVARQMGMGLDETAAALAVLSENGIKGAEAGTALKSMLLNMTRPTEDVQAAWERLGTSFYDAKGNMRPLPNVLADIKRGLSDMTPQEANETLKALAGSYGLVAMNALLGDLSITDMLDAMGNQASAAEIAAAKTNTLSGRFRALKNTLGTLLIAGFTPFVNRYLKPAIEMTTVLVSRLASLAALHPDLAAKVALAGAAFVALVGGLQLISVVAGVASGVIGLLAGTIGFLLSPIGLVVGLVAALGVVWATNFMGMRDATDKLGEAIRGIVGGLRQAYEEGGAEGVGKKIIGSLLAAAWDAAMWVRETILTPLADAIAGIPWDTIPNKTLDLLGRVFGLAAAGLASVGQWVWNTLLQPMWNYLNGVTLAGIINRLPELLEAFLGAALSGLGSVGQWVWDNLLQPILDALGADDLLASMYEKALAVGQKIFDAIVDAVTSLPETLVQMINDAIPNEINLGSVRHTFDLPGILGGPQTVDVKFGSIDLPDNPIPIPAFATGGIVTRPMLAMVGEKEPEAIIPLSRLGEGGVGRGIVVHGDVHVHGVQDVQGLLRELERAAARRDSRLTVPRGVS